MPSVRRLCGNCLCYHCETFVPAPQPFSNFVIPIQPKPSLLEQSIKDSITTNLQETKIKQNEEIASIMNRVNSQFQNKKRAFSETNFRNIQMSAPVTARESPRVTQSLRRGAPQVIIQTRPISVNTYSQRTPNVIYSPSHTSYIKNISKDKQFEQKNRYLTTTDHKRTFTPSFIQHQVVRSVNPEQSQLGKTLAQNSIKTFPYPPQRDLEESMAIIPNQFPSRITSLKDLKSQAGFQKNNTQQNLKITQVPPFKQGLISRPNLVPNTINISRRNKIQKCTFRDNRCLGIDLCSQKNTEIEVDETGHYKICLYKQCS